MEKTTPGGKTLVLKDQLLARDFRDLRLFQERSFNMTLDIVTNKPSVNSINLGDVMAAKEELVIRLAVVSYDGSPDDLVNRLLNGSAQEYEFVLAEAEKLTTLPKAQV